MRQIGGGVAIDDQDVREQARSERAGLFFEAEGARGLAGRTAERLHWSEVREPREHRQGLREIAVGDVGDSGVGGRDQGNVRRSKCQQAAAEVAMEA